MNRRQPKIRRAGRAPVLIICFCLGLVFSSIAQTNLSPAAGANPPAPDRFLVIYDISNGMEKRATNAQRVLGQMFASGLNGELERGDQIGAWTFNDELHTGEFALMRWVPQTGPILSATLEQFIQRQRYSKSPRFAPVMAQLTNVVADSDKLTVILVSDGSTAPVGTLFDDQIAEAFKLNFTEQRRLAMPFVTILRAVNGRFVSLRVNTPPWPIELPAYPGALATHPPPTNPPPSTPATSTPAPPVVPVVPEPLPVARTNPAPARATNVIVVDSTPPQFPERTNPSPAVVAAPASPPSNPPPAQMTPTNPSPAVAASSPDPKSPVTTPAKRFPVLPLAVGAGVVLVGFAILCLLLFKHSREKPRVSLITRSMNKDRK